MMLARITGLISTTLLIVATVATGMVSGEELKTTILLLKNDRLYFGAGTDELVFPGSRFLITLAGDTVYSGRMETSVVGVSFSYPTANFFDTIAINDCLATIGLARVDSTSRIHIDCINIHHELLSRDNSLLSYRSSSLAGCFTEINANGNDICLRSTAYPGYVPGVPDSLPADAVVGFRLPPSGKAGSSVLSAPAPFMAVMIPNLARAINKNAFFPISLYYQFNEQHLAQMFNGDNVRPIHSLYGSDSLARRFYPVDQEQGAKLLERLDEKPKQISIAVMDTALEGTAHYLADLLARQRIQTKLTTNPYEADLLLLFVPYYQTFPSASLEHIYTTLISFGTKERLPLEVLPQINDKLQAIRAHADPKTALNYCNQIDRMMKEDLGVFPLFQPTIYAVTQPHLRNFSFDADNFPNLKLLTRLILPALSQESQE